MCSEQAFILDENHSISYFDMGVETHVLFQLPWKPGLDSVSARLGCCKSPTDLHVMSGKRFPFNSYVGSTCKPYVSFLKDTS